MKNIEKQNVKHAFGKLISGTDFEDYAVNNNFINDNKNFIEKKNGYAKFSFAFIYQNETFGVWIDNKKGKIYVSYDYDKNTPFIFSTTLDNHSPNTLFLQSARNYNCWKHLINNFKIRKFTL